MLFKKTVETERNQDATIYIGNLAEQVDEALLYELFLQVAPIRNINVPKDRITQTHQGYGFVEFKNTRDAEYAENVMNGIKLYGKTIRVKRSSAYSGTNAPGMATGVNIIGNGSVGGPGAMTDLVNSARTIDVGANLFIGNLDELIDENFLASTFSRFGQLIKHPYIARDEMGKSKGYGFLSYADFESSDKAISELDGQYLMNKIVKVNYAYKKVGASRKTKGKERHGDEAERLLAKQAKKNHYSVLNDVPAVPAPQRGNFSQGNVNSNNSQYSSNNDRGYGGGRSQNANNSGRYSQQGQRSYGNNAGGNASVSGYGNTRMGNLRF